MTSTCVPESPSDGCCDDGPGLFPQPFMYLGHLWRWPARLEIGGSGAPAKRSRRAAKHFLTRHPSIAFLTFWTRRMLTVCSRARTGTCSNQARLTKSALFAPTREVLLQFTRPALSLGLAGTEHRPNETRHSGVCPKARRGRHCSLHSQRKCVGRHCCVCLHEPPWSLAASVPAPTVKRQVNHRRYCRRPAYQRALPQTTAGNARPAERSQVFFLVGGWYQRTCKPSSENPSRIHDFFVEFSSSLSFLKKSSDDAGRTDVRGLLAVPECPRNLLTRATVQVFNDANLVGPFVSSLFLLMKPAQESFHTRQ